MHIRTSQHATHSGSGILRFSAACRILEQMGCAEAEVLRSVARERVAKCYLQQWARVYGPTGHRFPGGRRLQRVLREAHTSALSGSICMTSLRTKEFPHNEMWIRPGLTSSSIHTPSPVRLDVPSHQSLQNTWMSTQTQCAVSRSMSAPAGSQR